MQLCIEHDFKKNKISIFKKKLNLTAVGGCRRLSDAIDRRWLSPAQFCDRKWNRTRQRCRWWPTSCSCRSCWTVRPSCSPTGRHDGNCAILRQQQRKRQIDSLPDWWICRTGESPTNGRRCSPATSRAERWRSGTWRRNKPFSASLPSNTKAPVLALRSSAREPVACKTLKTE